VEAEHSAPKSRKGRRRWPKRLNAYRKTFIPAQWQALMQAEADFADTQTALVAVRAAAMGDLQTMIAAAEFYDGIELCRINRAPTARRGGLLRQDSERGGSHEQRHKRRGQESNCERHSTKGRRPS
jgi:hypothetical protein